ncbi:MAG: ABC transporter ATP-binding protein [Devosia sp.]|nr:ABC transporter ATP-binding protein [Devosia sp.]
MLEKTDKADGSGLAISLENVDKIYPTATGSLEVFRSISLQIRSGEFISLVGPSGCGKSTILKIIAGLEPFNSGVVKVGGEEPRAGRRDIGFMFQQSVLMPWRTVRENVALPFEIAHDKSEKSKQRVLDLIDLVGLKNNLKLLPSELSGGMQQRVAFARTLALDPSILLLDEPFAALDEFKREFLNVEVAKIHDDLKKTSILVTHSIPEAVLMSDRVIALGAHPGRVLGDIAIDLPRPRTPDLIGTTKFQNAVKQIRDALAVTEVGAAA